MKYPAHKLEIRSDIIDLFSETTITPDDKKETHSQHGKNDGSRACIVRQGRHRAKKVSNRTSIMDGWF